MKEKKEYMGMEENKEILWLPLRRPLEPPVLQPPHADQDIYAEQCLAGS